MNAFAPQADLRVGHIVEVSGTTAKVELSGEVSELSRTHAGRVYEIGQIGSVVKIRFGRRVIFGFVTLLRMRSEELEELGRLIPPDADQRVMEIDLFAEGVWNGASNTLRFQRGISTYPLPRQSVFILTQQETAMLYEAAEHRVEGEANPLIPIGKYVGADSTVCRANIDAMFATHCAVLGSTGSGKSGAVAALMHSVLEHKAKDGAGFHPRIIVIDPHGEYGHAFGEQATVFRAYDPIGGDPGKTHPIVLPYWLMSAEEFRALLIGKTEHEATSQHNIVYKALTHARMAAAGLVKLTFSAYGEPDPSDGLELDEPRPVNEEFIGKIAEFDRDKPRPFSLDEFYNHIAFAQAAKLVGGVTKRISDSEFTSKGYKSILDKLTVLRRDPRVNFLMKNYEKDVSYGLSKIIVQLVGDISGKLETSIRVLDVSGLPNEVAGPLAAMIARILFQYKLYQSYEERENDPLLLVCEEAHRYVPDRGEAEYSAAQTAVRRIAREGRKYGLGLMLVSQRPADIESTVISQCGTWLVLRLTNSADQQHVARFLPDGLSGMVRALPALAQQEALFVGEGASLPARIRIRDLTNEQLPRSASISFARGWSEKRLNEDDLGAIVSRMVS
tara:strand:- start:132 stop:1979 length:1848 start_codon:yes stop_codon:yes gene_type:complete